MDKKEFDTVKIILAKLQLYGVRRVALTLKKALTFGSKKGNINF